MLRQHLKLAQNGGKLMILGIAEMEGDAPIGIRHHPRHVAPIGTVDRPAQRAQRLESPDHVGGGDGAAVMPAGGRVQLEADAQLVGGQIDPLRQMGVGSGGLVIRFDQQGVKEIGQANGRSAAQDEAVEAVEAAQSRQNRLAALRRVGIDPREMRKALGKFRLAQQSHGVATAGRLRHGRCCEKRGCRQKGTSLHRAKVAPPPPAGNREVALCSSAIPAI